MVNSTEEVTMPSRAKRTLTLLAVLLVAVVGFTAGWHLSDDETTRGYSLGNQDGYSTGYNDGQKGADPDPHRFMAPQDYALRTQIGGREIEE